MCVTTSLLRRPPPRMTILAIIDRMTGIAFSRIGPGLNGMRKSEIAPVTPLRHRIPLFVAVETKHTIAMTLGTVVGILLGIDLMLLLPTRLVTLGFGKPTIDVTGTAGGARGIHGGLFCGFGP